MNRDVEQMSSRAAVRAQKLARIEHVLFAMVASGEKVTFAEVERRAKVSHTFVFSPPARQMILEAQHDPDSVIDPLNDDEVPDGSAIFARLQHLSEDAARHFAHQRALLQQLLEIAAEFDLMLAESSRYTRAARRYLAEQHELRSVYDRQQSSGDE